MQAVKLVSTKDLSHDDWLDWRRKGIGGSDVAAICGLSRYKSPVEVYLDKLGEIPPIPDNPKMLAGRKLEPFIADWFADDTGMKVQKRNFMYRHPEHEFMFANIDRWLPTLNSGLEIKNTSEYGRDDWAGTQAPQEYILQCNHYMAVTGAERWYIAVLIGGWDFQWRVIERDEELINNLIIVEREFWTNHVLLKLPPPYSHQDTARLGEMYPQSISESIDLPEDAYPIILDLHEARKAKDIALTQEETAKNRIKSMMGDAERAYWQGDLAFTWKSGKKGRTFRVIGGND